jgi:hypothetical protein
MIYGIIGWTMIFGCAMIEVGCNHSHHSIIEIMVSLRDSLLPKLMRGEVRVK